MDNLRILVVGVSGSGKSTLAKKLSHDLGIPVLHLDRIWHSTNYDNEGTKFLIESQIGFIEKNPSFIIDGNYSGTMDVRIPHSNIIIWLKSSKWKSLFRVFTRSIKTKLGYLREDMAEEFKEKFDKEYLEFLKFIWNFEKNNVPKIEKNIAKRSDDCELFIIKNRQELDRLLTNLKVEVE